MDKVEFSVEALRKLMQKEDLKPAGLARRINVSRACISRILNGQRKPSIKVIEALKQEFPKYSLDNYFLP